LLRRGFLLIASLLLLAIAPARAAAWKPEPASYGVASLTNVPIRMSDGTVLRADVDVPVPPGHSQPVRGMRFPTLVSQTAYYKDGPISKIPAYLVQRGYAFVLADVRGTGSSDGQWQMLGPLEQEDGVEVIHWAARQPWSNGRIGLAGSSYGAINQLLIMERPDAPREVKAILPVAPMADPYRDLFFHGGAFDDEFMTVWLGLTSTGSLTPPQQIGSDPTGALLLAGEHATGLDLPVTLVSSALSGGALAYDGPYWQQRAPIEHIDRVRVPTMILGGEFDIFQRGEPLLFQKLRARAKRLIIGPWTHSNDGATLPADGIPSQAELALQWYDQYLRGERTAVDRAPRVEQYRLEGPDPSHFVASSSWPLPGLHPLDLYLAGAPSGSARSLNDGSLGPRPASEHSEDALPYNPTGTPCTRETFQWGNAGTATNEASSTTPCEGDQRVDETQDLTYTTAPLTQPLTIDGPIDLHLVARSPQRANTTFSVTVCDVAPDGRSTAITGGWLVASMRATKRSPLAMSAAGQPLRVYHPFTAQFEQQPSSTPTSYDIEIFPTFATFRPGHRLRLDIGTGQLPHVAPTEPQATSSVGGTFMIDHSAAHDTSRLILPMIQPTGVSPGAHPRHGSHGGGHSRRGSHHGGHTRRRPGHRRAPRPPVKPPPRPAHSLITYGISPTFTFSDPNAPAAKLAFSHLAQLRGGHPLMIHLYLPWSGYPQNVAALDTMIRAYAQRGFKVDIVLRYAPPAGHDGDTAGFARFVSAAVDHYARQPAVVRLGITNESNFSLDKRGSMGGADGQYSDPIGALVKGMDAAYHERARDHAHFTLGFNWAYRGCDPTACGPTADTDYWTELGRRGGSRFAQEVDWVTMDIYPGTIFPPGDPSADPYQPGLSPSQEVARAIEDLRYQMMPLAGLGMNKPIGIQEISWASVPPARSEQEQASLLRQFAAGACSVAAQTNFRTFYWFTLNDGTAPAAAQLNFGLYHGDGTPKPAAAAYTDLIRSGCHG